MSGLTQPAGSNGSRVDAIDSREALARVRDELGTSRDREAALRDQLADAADAQIDEFERSDRNGGSALATAAHQVVSAARDRERARADRDGAAVQRASAARDRDAAARDRLLAAADRAHAAAQLAAAGVDELTGALRRGVGMISLEREIARAHRTNEPLVVAFVDVDGLKRVNDTQGHLAGDRLLQRAGALIKSHLRPYDLTVRVGGDEFVCALGGVGRDSVRKRLAQVGTDLAAGPGGGSVSFGLAELEPGDSVDGVIGRADRALLAVRGRRGARTRGSRRRRR